MIRSNMLRLINSHHCGRISGHSVFNKPQFNSRTFTTISANKLGEKDDLDVSIFKQKKKEAAVMKSSPKQWNSLYPFVTNLTASKLAQSTDSNLKLSLNFPTTAVSSKITKSYESNEAKIKKYGFDDDMKEEDMVGRGLFAKVYKIIDPVSLEAVAVKVIDKSKCPKEVYGQELKVMSQMKDLKLKRSNSREHFDISALSLHNDAFETEDKMCFVFDLHKGGELFREIENEGAFSEDECKTLMQTLMPSLESLHAAGFLHRDIKLENILLDDGAEITTRLEKVSSARLTDYGYSRRTDDSDRFTSPVGTFGYVAPEVLRSLKYGPECDVWSLGVVLYAAMAGYLPFPYKPGYTASPNASNQELVEAELEAIEHGTQPEIWNSELQKAGLENFSDEAKDLLSRMLDPNPATRITSKQILEHPWFLSDNLATCEA